MIGSGGACGNFAQGDDLIVSLEKSRRVDADVWVPTSRGVPLDVAETAPLLNALRALRATDCTIMVMIFITTLLLCWKLSMI